MKIKPTSTRGQFEVGFVGTAWCIVDDKFLVTAHHVFNDGKSRNPGHRYYVFAVPGNGATVFMFPVINFPLEDQANDMAIVEIGSPLHGAYTLGSVPVTSHAPSMARQFSGTASQRRKWPPRTSRRLEP